MPTFSASYTTCVSQRIPSLVSAFNNWGLISSSTAALPGFIPLIAIATSAALKTSSFSLNVSLSVSHEWMPLQD